MKVGPFHLSYCTNVHPGETWSQILTNLKYFLPAVRNRLGLAGPFAAGIWLPQPAVSTLSDSEELDYFLDFLTTEKLYISGVNAFPYGNFHAPPVKESVYLPDWTDWKRIDYSNRVADILARILQKLGLQEGNLSTVPGAFKPSITRAEQVDIMARNFLEHAAHLHGIHRQTGCTITLAIEPEPYCYLETTDEVIQFFHNHLISPSALNYFSHLAGVEETDAEAIILRHLGICLDVCHLAVQFEDPIDSIQRLQKEGIQIPRVQLSSAATVKIEGDLQQILERLSYFDEKVYLHQVVEQDLSAIRRFPDLPEALEALKSEGPDFRPKQWRIHFHLPLFLTETDDFGTTQSAVVKLLQSMKEKLDCKNLEVETYTWDVLPSNLQTDDRVADIARELQWVRSQLWPVETGEDGSSRGAR